jgi:ABC-type nitrate/sulfonate/bicarbonate transport system permease component
MKNDDQEQLESLLSIFTGYQVGTVLAILLGILVVTIYLLPDAAMLLIILVIVLIVPYIFANKADRGERGDEL